MPRLISVSLPIDELDIYDGALCIGSMTLIKCVATLSAERDGSFEVECVTIDGKPLTGSMAEMVCLSIPLDHRVSEWARERCLEEWAEHLEPDPDRLRDDRLERMEMWA